MTGISFDTSNPVQGPTVYVGGGAFSEKGWKDKFLLILKWRTGQISSNDSSNFTHKSVEKSDDVVGFYAQCKICNKYLLKANTVQHFYCCHACYLSYTLCGICGKAVETGYYQHKSICSTCFDYGRYRRSSSLRIIKYVPVKE